jgi:hypothetical protein
MTWRRKVVDLIGAVVLLVVLAVVGIYDVFAITSQGAWPTVSERLYEWCQHFPILPLFVGIVLGHVFFPLRYKAGP